jgi:TatD DNase family protein
MLNLEEFGGKLEGVITAAKEKGVEEMLCVGVTWDTIDQVKEIAERFENIHCSVGIHPCDCEGEIVERDKIIAAANHPKVVAIGETGLDYFRLEENAEQEKQIQQQSFRNQIQAAIEVDKPLIIHTRAAADDTIRILQEENAERCRGVLHCFTETWEMAQQALELGFYISISGIVTFKKADQIKDVASKVPLNRLLVETDAPYLAPVPHRGKQNHPGLTRYVAEYIAELRGISYAEVAEQTTQNYFELFKGAQRG